MAEKYSSNAALVADLRHLIDGWCERRCLQPLAQVLPAYTGLNGLADGWGELLKALQSLTLCQDALLPKERDIVADLRGAVERMFR